MSLDVAPLDPVIAHFIALAQERLGHLDLAALGIAELRRQSDELGNEIFREVAEPGPEVASVTDLDAGGVKVKLYRPPSEGPHGLYVVLHGGGWWQGSIEDWISDVQARERCVGADCVVAMVEYGLAPEHPFPAGLEDSFTAFTWLQDHAAELGCDPERIVLGGVSAGGNLAGALTLLLRDRGHRQPALTVYEAAPLDMSTDYASCREYGTGYGIEIAAFEQILTMYLPNAEDRTSPLASPVRAESLDGLGPAHFMTGECDPLRDLSDAYAARLAETGVAVTSSRFAGQIHTSPVMTKVLPAARAWRDEVNDVVSRVTRAGAAVSSEVPA